jgi:hypothetical protein
MLKNSPAGFDALALCGLDTLGNFHIIGVFFLPDWTLTLRRLDTLKNSPSPECFFHMD